MRIHRGDGGNQCRDVGRKSYLMLGEGAEIPESRFIRQSPAQRSKDPAAAPTAGRPFSKDTLEADNSIEVVVVGGGTNTYRSVGDFSCLSSADVDQWR